ncbi:hypothetical protein HY085_00620 [Candidatus Gottesmanbacteria bacterium]|nr:hypothetical protein [Candidatus Gottesmanbacteria bacterium]
MVVWIQGVKLFQSGIVDSNGNLIFWGEVLFHDSNVHLSLISEMLARFPPTNFSSTLDGIATLKNYHYFYDLILAFLVKVTGISLFDLYFRLAPVLVSVLLSLAIYLVVWRLTKNRIVAAWAIFFTVFATSFGSILPFIKIIFSGGHVTGGSNIFMTDQLVDMLVNPHGGLSLVIFLAIALSFWEYEAKKEKKYLGFLVFLLAVSFGIKAYGGLVFGPAAIVAIFWFLIRKKDAWPLIATFLGLLAMGLSIIATISPGVAGVQLAPFWLLEKMMIELDRVNEPRYLLLLQHYQATGNILRILLLYLTALVIYLVGSLGLRIFGLIGIVRSICRWKELSGGLVFFLAGATVSFFVPVFFNQTKKAYDIVQFTPYFTITAGIFFSIFICRRPFRWLTLIFLGLLFLFLNKNEIAVRLDKEKIVRDRVIISREVISAADYIRTRTPTEAVFLLSPSDYNFRFPWFTALTSRRAVYGGRGFAFQVGIDTAKAERRVLDIFAGREKYENFDYLFLTRTEERQFAKIKELYNFRTVFENNEALILKKEQ